MPLTLSLCPPLCSPHCWLRCYLCSTLQVSALVTQTAVAARVKLSTPSRQSQGLRCPSIVSGDPPTPSHTRNILLTTMSSSAFWITARQRHELTIVSDLLSSTVWDSHHSIDLRTPRTDLPVQQTVRNPANHGPARPVTIFGRERLFGTVSTKGSWRSSITQSPPPARLSNPAESYTGNIFQRCPYPTPLNGIALAAVIWPDSSRLGPFLLQSQSSSWTRIPGHYSTNGRGGCSISGYLAVENITEPGGDVALGEGALFESDRPAARVGLVDGSARMSLARCTSARNLHITQLGPRYASTSKSVIINGPRREGERERIDSESGDIGRRDAFEVDGGGGRAHRIFMCPSAREAGEEGGPFASVSPLSYALRLQRARKHRYSYALRTSAVLCIRARVDPSGCPGFELLGDCIDLDFRSLGRRPASAPQIVRGTTVEDSSALVSGAVYLATFFLVRAAPPAGGFVRRIPTASWHRPSSSQQTRSSSSPLPPSPFTPFFFAFPADAVTKTSH
ncbi:hypothetical protein B0H16DRAFT_1695784 [Mycena metata]|uniref:Uncharacterized protein n=1 Tax=Mycena metata TaxID=1033252 RepID=A0AAD7I5J4_9AGAR|nr:hypothetical protein B0H16DRAFT_1695784 [Mycena metata]